MTFHSRKQNVFVHALFLFVDMNYRAWLNGVSSTVNIYHLRDIESKQHVNYGVKCMEKRFKISEFAALVGTTAKTIYHQIEKGALTTVTEPYNGRKMQFIVTNDKQIAEFKEIYGKMKVTNGNYEDILTSNNRENPVKEIQSQAQGTISESVIEKLMTLNTQLQDRLLNYSDELSTYKGQIPLLEDKAGREGVYLKEINELKKVNNRKNILLITVIIISLSVIIGLVFALMYQHFNPVVKVQDRVINKIITVENGKIKSVLTEPEQK